MSESGSLAINPYSGLGQTNNSYLGSSNYGSSQDLSQSNLALLQEAFSRLFSSDEGSGLPEIGSGFDTSDLQNSLPSIGDETSTYGLNSLNPFNQLLSGFQAETPSSDSSTGLSALSAGSGGLSSLGGIGDDASSLGALDA